MGSVVCWCLYFDFGKTCFALKFVYCCKSSPGERGSNPEAGWRATGVGGHIQACGVGDHSPALRLDAVRPLISLPDCLGCSNGVINQTK
jgi:hypothetical protein